MIAIFDLYNLLYFEWKLSFLFFCFLNSCKILTTITTMTTTVTTTTYDDHVRFKVSGSFYTLSPCRVEQRVLTACPRDPTGSESTWSGGWTHGTARHDTIRHDIARHSTAQQRTEQKRTAWCAVPVNGHGWFKADRHRAERVCSVDRPSLPRRRWVERLHGPTTDPSPLPFPLPSHPTC